MGFEEINLIEYKGDCESKCCSICKLELRENQKIFMCTFCKNLFHKEHIFEWLENDNECPVCQRVIKKKLKINDKITNQTHEIITETIHLERTAQFIFNNPLTTESWKLKRDRAIFILFGIVFIVFPIFPIRSTLIESGMDFLEGVLPSILFSLFALAGIVLIIIPFLRFYSFKYKWINIEFLSDRILITGNFRQKELKFNINEIDALVVGQETTVIKSEEDFSTNNITHYCIRFKIILKNRQKYDFKYISRLKFENKHDSLYYNFRNMLLEVYENVEIKYPN